MSIFPTFDVSFVLSFNWCGGFFVFVQMCVGLRCSCSIKENRRQNDTVGIYFIYLIPIPNLADGIQHIYISYSVSFDPL